jgi:hypothetical protein
MDPATGDCRYPDRGADDRNHQQRGERAINGIYIRIRARTYACYRTCTYRCPSTYTSTRCA